VAYENAVAHWEETGGEHGMPPVPTTFDEDFSAIQVGKELGIPALDVEDLPLHWRGTVYTMWAWRDLEEKRHNRRAKHSAKSSSGPRRSGPRGN
jgi:hypothetical protein